MLDSEEEEQISSSTNATRHDSLDFMDRPSSELLYDGPFEYAKDAGKARNKLFLVNVQSRKEFSSAMLNRDDCANEIVVEAIKNSFVFWQEDEDTEEGKKVGNYYRLHSLPAILLIDPITGQNMRSWNGIVEPQKLLEDAMLFMDTSPSEIAIRLPDGRRIQRNFLKTDLIKLLWSFCSTHIEAAETRQFLFTQAMPGGSKCFEYDSNLTFEESGLANSIVSVVMINYILSGLQDDLYNVYSGTKTSKELWGTLERKYKMEDARIKKFLVARFLDFKMIDSKSVVSQVQELQVIIHDLLAEGLIVNDVFQVAAIVEKLSALWKDFKNYLKHKRKEMTIEDLIVRLRIEEDNKAAERRSKENSTMSGVHIIEDGQNNSKKIKKVEHGSNQPKKKFKGKCFNCGKIGHKSTDCRASKKGKKKDQANMIESNQEYDDLCAMFTECNLVGNPREWWMNLGATLHVCANKELFSSFAPAQAEEML
ncbi:Plant UBX domain-containing protein 7 [Capsicum chinense]|nr:Plant UBX domain-containing protein 7 [Capsicum chinense]